MLVIAYDFPIISHINIPHRLFTQQQENRSGETAGSPTAEKPNRAERQENRTRFPHIFPIKIFLQAYPSDILSSGMPRAIRFVAKRENGRDVEILDIFCRRVRRLLGGVVSAIDVGMVFLAAFIAGSCVGIAFVDWPIRRSLWREHVGEPPKKAGLR